MPRSPRSKSQVYATLAVAALKEHAHCVRMMQGAATSRIAQQWEEEALREESAAVGFTMMAAYHARSQEERVAQ